MTGTLLLEMTRKNYLVESDQSRTCCALRLVGVSQNNSNNNTKYLTKKSAENVMFSAVIFCVKCKSLKKSIFSKYPSKIGGIFRDKCHFV